MTTPSNDPTQPAPRRGGNGGRPRDPELTPRVLDAVIDILAVMGHSAVSSDLIAEHAGCGKASLYRRWPSMAAMIADAVATLGVRPDDVHWGPVVGGISWQDDVVAVVHAAVAGQRAKAEQAILSALPFSPELRDAYEAGPARAIDDALSAVLDRAIARGDAASWVGRMPIRAAIALLQTWTALADEQPTRQDVTSWLELVGVLPRVRA